MNPRLLLLSLFAFLSFCSTAQTNGMKRQGNSFIFSGNANSLRIDFCNPSLFRVRCTWDKKFDPDEQWMVIKYDWSPVNLTIKQGKGFYLLQSSAVTVKVYTPSLQIEVLDKNNKLISKDQMDTGGNYIYQGRVGCIKDLSPNEHFFGFGERMDFLDRRNKKLQLNVGRGKGMPHIIGAYNILEANYSPVPFFMSTKGYGIFFHTAYPTEWDMGSTSAEAYNFSSEGDKLDYYFLYGPSFPSILDQYTSLTGKSPMMSLFAYGLHMGTYSGGTWGYEEFTSDKYVIELAKKLRAMGIPVDILWLDSTWRIFGEVGGKGATSFEWRETFKDPKGMFDSLYAMHFKMAGLHLRPRFDNGKTIKLLDTAQRLKFTYPEGNSPGEFVNFFDSAAVDFWWKHGVMRVATQGARFLKTDEGSAFGGLANESDKTGPQGKEIASLHNLFPLAYAKAPYEEFQQFNHMRGMNQTREGYAGIQRYPYIFAGDWPSEWQYFAPVIKAGLNIGLSGVGHWTHCMGGFEHPADPELYMRWVQFGMFSPLAMVFGMDHPGYKEPWNYGEEALANFKKYDSLRYRLLPYIYSNAYEMYKTGLPLMRALVLNYQDDENVYEIGDQYLFGNDIMVCPVTTKGAQTRTVYLPEGKWVDYWTGMTYTGKQYIHIVTTTDILPLFVKAGAVIPMQPPMNYTGEKPVDPITLDVFIANDTSIKDRVIKRNFRSVLRSPQEPSALNKFNLYEDDGQSLRYLNNEYSLTPITVESTAGSTRLTIGKPEGVFKRARHRYFIKAHIALKPLTIMVNGKVLQELKVVPANDQVGCYYDALKKIYYINPGFDNSSVANITIF